MNNIIRFLSFSLSAFFYFSVCTGAFAYEKSPEKTKDDCVAPKPYIFSWSLLDVEGKEMAPRGGTTKGAKVKLDPNTSAQWLDLQQKELKTFEKDRAAILAMAGAYRTSFDFIEVMGFSTEFKPDKPYNSWGTEYVYVLEDRGDFISLQHIMVMVFEMDGKLSDPMPMKHWRQDWSYEKREIFEYRGNATWATRKLSKREVKGAWSQAVYQVDDSPRYESYGTWEHRSGFSTWQSALTWRPLPRREHSVRDDYNVLEGVNRHTILPSGWVHEQENYKLSVDAAGQPIKSAPYLSKEIGLNRYERIVDFDFSVGDEYLDKTKGYWRDVRSEWARLASSTKPLTLQKSVDGKKLYALLFAGAEMFWGEKYDEAKSRAYVTETISSFSK